jgi:hypothetical protein
LINVSIFRYLIFKDLKGIVVPHYKELATAKVFADKIEEVPRFADYFPDYLPGQLPPRKFFWDVYSTLYYDEVSDMIKEVNELHYHNCRRKKDRKPFTIREDIYQTLRNLNYYSKRKGRALHYIDFEKRKKKVEERKKKHNDRFDYNKQVSSPRKDAINFQRLALQSIKLGKKRKFNQIEEDKHPDNMNQETHSNINDEENEDGSAPKSLQDMNVDIMCSETLRKDNSSDGGYNGIHRTLSAEIELRSKRSKESELSDAEQNTEFV